MIKPCLGVVLKQATHELTQESPSPRMDAELLMSHVLHASRAFLYTHPEYELSDAELSRYHAFIEKRQTGVPIAYLIESREFWSLTLRVTPDTLIPRPETEQLVEQILVTFGAEKNAHILDLGTGSGAIALALASERPTWRIWAVDQSEAALNVARDNARALHIQNTTFFQSNWFQALPPACFDAIVSNPPYIAANDAHINQGDLRFEPSSALISSNNGLCALEHIIQCSPSWLKSNGLLLLEHGYTQAPAVFNRLVTAGYHSIRCWQDAAGHDRISGGWWKNSL